MTKRNATGTTQVSHGRRRVNVPRIDELAASVPAPSGTADSARAAVLAQVQRAPSGTVADPQSAALLGQLGGLAKAARDRGLRALEGLGLKGAAPEILAGYLADAEAFAVSEISRLALEAGRGVCGPMPSSMVQSAALELAGSRAAFAMGDVLGGSKLAGASRANLLCAFDLCVKQAHERPQNPQDLSAQIAAACLESVDNE